MTEAVFLFDQTGTLGQHFKAAPLEELRSEHQIREAFAKQRQAVWIASSGSFIQNLVSVASGHGDRRVLILETVEGARHEQLRVLFRVVITLNSGIKLLPPDELAEAIQSPDRQDLFIGGTVNTQDGTVVLFRGNLDPLVIPLSWFGTDGDFEVIDFGHGVRVGSVEAATDAILYEFDALARRRAKKRSLEQDRSFGGALRRLRIQRKLSRNDFDGVSEKEVARIERGEVGRPHPETLKRLAARLGVEPDKIETY